MSAGTSHIGGAHSIGYLRVALVHHWLVGMRGGEKVLEALCELFPAADIFTLVVNPANISHGIRRHNIISSWIQRLPGAQRHHGRYLPLFPFAMEQFDLSRYDLVISSDACVAKGVLTRPETCHICYCHSPLRYAWSAYHTYLHSVAAWKQPLLSLVLNYLRLWDYCAVGRVDYFAANSKNVSHRIEKYYRRESTVIYPPVAVSQFYSSSGPGKYYLTAGQWVRYKRFDLAIEAFNRLDRPLWIVGEGPEGSKLRKMAGSNIRFLGRLGDFEFRQVLSECRALIFPGEEDFGIIPVEAHASGRPVIALARGGAVETVEPGVNGILFEEESVEALCDAVIRFEAAEREFDVREIQASAVAYDERHFFDAMTTFIGEKLAEHRRRFGPAARRSRQPVSLR